MRIVLGNGHCNSLLMVTMENYLLKEKPILKYTTLLKGVLAQGNIEVLNFVSKNGIFCKPTYVHLPFQKALAKWESNYVLKRNGFEDRIRTISDINEIRDDDIVIGFALSRFGFECMKEMKGRKVLHLNQYYCVSLDVLNQIVPYVNGFICEANVFDEGNYIKLCKLPHAFKMCLTPFIVQERFKNLVPFEQRKQKAIAMGSIGPCNNPDYVSLYKTNLIHRMRQVIYDNKERLSAFMDVSISPWVAENRNLLVRPTDSKFLRILKMIGNNTIYKNPPQKYFAFDIVKKYNEYQMSVVPEEICGIPAIGAFESMACGCAFIGINHHMYTDLGMIPDYHYICYDGTLEGLEEKILYYQNHFDELEKISRNGQLFVENELNEKKVIKMFINGLH